MEENEKYLISVVVPCFNYAHFLPETLDSLLAQTYRNWECIIVDDGSTDNTKEVAEEYAEKDKRFRYIYQENKNAPSARNNGIRNAKGDFIQFLDSDDFITEDKFLVQVSAYEKNRDADIIYSEYICFDNDDRNKTWIYSRVLLKGDPAYDFASQWEKKLSIPIHCFLYKKSCFERWGSFDEKFISGNEDWDLHLRFAIGNAKYLFTKGQMAIYRVSRKSKVRSNPKKMHTSKRILLKKFLFHPQTSLYLRTVFLRRYLFEIFFGRTRALVLEKIKETSLGKKMINFMKKIR